MAGLTKKPTAPFGVYSVEDLRASTSIEGVVSATDTQGTVPWIVSGGVVTTLPSPKQGAYTDRSGSVAAGGVAQTLAAANPSRVYLLIQNNGVDSLWINFGTDAVTAEPSIVLFPGSTYISDPQFVSTERVSVTSNTTGVTYTAKEA